LSEKNGLLLVSLTTYQTLDYHWHYHWLSTSSSSSSSTTTTTFFFVFFFFFFFYYYFLLLLVDVNRAPSKEMNSGMGMIPPFPSEGILIRGVMENLGLFRWLSVLCLQGHSHRAMEESETALGCDQMEGSRV
jgi:hypothetical protein